MCSTQRKSSRTLLNWGPVIAGLDIAWKGLLVAVAAEAQTEVEAFRRHFLTLPSQTGRSVGFLSATMPL